MKTMADVMTRRWRVGPPEELAGESSDARVRNRAGGVDADGLSGSGHVDSASSALNIGATVKMTRHIGALFLYTIVNRIGDDCDIKDARGRIIPNVPVEFLQRVGDEPKSVEAT